MTMFIIFGAKYLIYISIIVACLIAFLLRKHFPALCKLSIISFPLAYIVAIILRHFFYNPRPFVVGNFKPLIKHVADNGFPSDHVLFLATIAAVLYPFSKKGSILLWVLTLIVAWARVAAGVHHVIDVVGSALIAIFVVSLVNYFFSSKLGEVTPLQ